MIAELFREYGLPLIVGVEIDVESVDNARPVIIDHDTTCLGTIGLSSRIWTYTFHPGRRSGDIIVGAQEHVLAAMVV